MAQNPSGAWRIYLRDSEEQRTVPVRTVPVFIQALDFAISVAQHEKTELIVQDLSGMVIDRFDYTLDRKGYT